ncbi:MAG TPA: dihydrodipicolinate synthase family protein [Micromonosporaceae bacterium]
MTLDLHGIIPPLVTPFGADESVLEDAVRAEVRLHLDAGVHGICVTGSTGEGASLSAQDTVAVARAAVKECAGSRPVIAGIIRDSLSDVVRYGQALKETGVDALQITPVHYLFTPDGETTFAYYERIAAEVGLPIVVYNVVPWATIDPVTLARILDDIPLVVAVKQSGGDIHALATLLHLGPTGGKVLTAIDDLLYPSFTLGAAGAIAATLTVVPGLCVDLWNATQAGDHATALAIHNRLLGVWQAIGGPNMPARIKVALAMLGRDGGQARSPMSPVTDAERAQLEQALRDAGVL